MLIAMMPQCASSFPRAVTLVLTMAPSLALAQATVYPVGAGRPTLEQARKEMGIPSTDELRGQVDNVGYASKPEAMAKIWELAAQPPAPLSLGHLPAPGVVGLVGPHDDYVYAARVDRRIYPLVTAKTVVVVGVFHRYRRFGAHDQMVFDSLSRAGARPTGRSRSRRCATSSSRRCPRTRRSRTPPRTTASTASRPSPISSSTRAPDVEIVPVLIPAASFARLSTMATHLGDALAATMKKHKLQLGRDVAVIISTDGTHYGSDFSVHAVRRAAGSRRSSRR